MPLYHGGVVFLGPPLGSLSGVSRDLFVSDSKKSKPSLHYLLNMVEREIQAVNISETRVSAWVFEWRGVCDFYQGALSTYLAIPSSLFAHTG